MIYKNCFHHSIHQCGALGKEPNHYIFTDGCSTFCPVVIKRLGVFKCNWFLLFASPY